MDCHHVTDAVQTDLVLRLIRRAAQLGFTIDTDVTGVDKRISILKYREPDRYLIRVYCGYTAEEAYSFLDGYEASKLESSNG